MENKNFTVKKELEKTLQIVNLINRVGLNEKLTNQILLKIEKEKKKNRKPLE